MDTKFKFKENRRYVHGPDIFYAVSRYIEKIEGKKPGIIKLVSKHITEHQLYVSETALDNKTVQSLVNYSIDDLNKKLFIYESDVEVTDIKEYDESDIVEHSEIEGFTGIIKNYSRYSVAEISVAVLKEICNLSISNEVKWVFVGLELDSRIEENTTKQVKIVLTKNLGTKMVVSDIYLDSDCVGQLKFSSLPK